MRLIRFVGLPIFLLLAASVAVADGNQSFGMPEYHFEDIETSIGQVSPENISVAGNVSNGDIIITLNGDAWRGREVWAFFYTDTSYLFGVGFDPDGVARVNIPEASGNLFVGVEAVVDGGRELVGFRELRSDR